MSSCHLSPEGIEALITMTALHTLNLDFAKQVSNDNLFALSALEGLTSLSMQACGSGKTPIGCWTLAALRHMTRLADLNLSKGHFTPLALLPLGDLTHLTRLQLVGCWRLCSSDIKVLSSLRQLHRLNLDSCAVLTDDSMQTALPSTLWQLTALTISKNSALTDVILSHLCSLTALQFLDVSDCTGISEQAVDKLFVALPQAQQIFSNGVDTDIIPLRALQGCNMVPC